MAGRLEGLTAVVTGGAGGHGPPICLEFAREGARVVVNDFGVDGLGRERSEPERAQRVVDAIAAEGGEAIADFSDIADFEQAGRLVDRAIDAWGKLDILVNVAGTIRVATIEETTPDDWESQISVHMTGYYNTTHHAAKHWIERREYGRLINFSSDAGIWHGHPTIVAYCAAKAGVVGLTRSCANGLAAYNVTANAIGPHGDSAVMGEAMVEAKRVLAETGEHLSDRSRGTDRDCAHAAPLIVYLASPQAGHISGRVFSTYGGRYTLYSEPIEEREIRVNWLDEPERVYEEIERTLTTGLDLRDLKFPIAPKEVVGLDWQDRIGVQAPKWDFEPATTAARS
jgi:NAD(P)-dependent dehydrogenase (short-subunit alcohol dehydrogenase family)